MAPAVDVMEAVQPSGKAIASENAMSEKTLDTLMSQLTVSKSQDEISASAHNIATFINGPIEEHAVPTK
jgi:elongation factor 3